MSTARAYAAAGLETHTKKAVRRAIVSNCWGATVEGDVGLNGPPRHRLFRLAELTAAAANAKGFPSPRRAA